MPTVVVHRQSRRHPCRGAGDVVELRAPLPADSAPPLTGGKRALVCASVDVDKGCAVSLRGLVLICPLPYVTTSAPC